MRGQDVTLGLFRSDYMVQVSRDDSSSRQMLAIKQVEFNTYSIAGGTHANKAAHMHESVIFSSHSKESRTEAGTGICTRSAPLVFRMKLVGRTFARSNVLPPSPWRKLLLRRSIFLWTQDILFGRRSFPPLPPRPPTR